LSANRVFVVCEAQKLNDSSQNSLLKVLEEPPEYCCIILLCTRPDKLLPTTKSRCQILRFGPIAEQRIIEKLTEMGIEAIKARYFARLALGSLGQACEWARLELAGAELYSTKKKLIDTLAACKYAEALNHAEWILSASKAIAGKWADVDEATSKTDISRRTQKTLVAIAISALHDAMMLNLADTDSIINSDQKTRINELAERFDLGPLSQKIADCYRLMREIDASVNERLIFEQLLLNLAVLDRMKV
jgi:DNA polymerase-3 subunit delta'